MAGVLSPPLPSFASASMSFLAPWAQGLMVALYVAAQVLLAIYSSHRYLTLWRWWRRPRARGAPRPPASWPPVTVQLPLFNERRVAERLIDAVAALDYPPDQLEIQVLDDSTDETSERVDRAVARHRARGAEIRVLRRSRRDGFKAGALAAGLAEARGELLAVFDADFVPRSDFLIRAVPHFADPGVGMVQARWSHLNRDRSLMTAAQAVMLDSHFMLEHQVRMTHGLFFNFNGTAGAWRRSCIESAGGWRHDTLTEDLDLSYRAQLKGWRFVFDPAVEAPAELPADMEALKSQQRRWAKGSIQTARKLLPAVFEARLPLRLKIEAFFHLTSNVAYPLLLALGLLLPPVMLARPIASPTLALLLELGAILTGVVPVAIFLAAGQAALGAGRWRTLRDVAAALVIGAGLSVNNARAVLEGLGRRVGDWERTPKSGDRMDRPARAAYRSAPPRSGPVELALAAYFAALVLLTLELQRGRALPFVVLLLLGFAYVGWASVESRLAWRRGGAAAAASGRS